MLEVVGYVLLGLLAVVLLLPAFPVYVRLTFYKELSVAVSLLGIPVFRFSSTGEKPPKAEKLKEQQTGVSEKDKPEKENPYNPLPALAVRLKNDGIGEVLRCVGDLVRIAGGAFKRVLRALTVDKLLLRLVVAGKDASETAQTTGKISAILYPGLSVLQYALRIRKREVTVTPDFLTEKGKAEAEVTVHAVPYRLLWAAMTAFFAYRKWNHALQIQATQNVQEGQNYGK